MRYTIQWIDNGHFCTAQADSQITADSCAKAVSKLYDGEATVYQGAAEVVKYRHGELVWS